MASLGETFVTKSYVKGKKMPGMKKKAGEYDRIWRPKSKSSEGLKNPGANRRHAMVSGLTPAQKVARAKKIGTEGPKKTMPNPMSPAAKKAMQNMGTRGQRPPMTKKVTRNVSKRGMR